MATIGELANVPEPGSGVTSAWAQDVTARAQHRYASKGALDAWTTALAGTQAVTLDDGGRYQKTSTGWARLSASYLYNIGIGGAWSHPR